MLQSCHAAEDVDWVRIIPSGTAPAIRYWHTGAYSETADALLVFGGFSGASSVLSCLEHSELKLGGEEGPS